MQYAVGDEGRLGDDFNFRRIIYELTGLAWNTFEKLEMEVTSPHVRSVFIPKVTRLFFILYSVIVTNHYYHH